MLFIESMGNARPALPTKSMTKGGRPVSSPAEKTNTTMESSVNACMDSTSQVIDVDSAVVASDMIRKPQPANLGAVPTKDYLKGNAFAEVNLREEMGSVCLIVEHMNTSMAIAVSVLTVTI